MQFQWASNDSRNVLLPTPGNCCILAAIVAKNEALLRSRLAKQIASERKTGESGVTRGE
ncbi:hypothetical protein [Advenella kashmirensis]|uniref:hypothetical protein n=1 Tax=Advenella kashmirensis TaxID=310575 RepID=UPI000305A2C1|nr:hypothetical protein [Advenella kashmirensis]